MNDSCASTSCARSQALPLPTRTHCWRPQWRGRG